MGDSTTNITYAMRHVAPPVQFIAVAARLVNNKVAPPPPSPPPKTDRPSHRALAELKTEADDAVETYSFGEIKQHDFLVPSKSIKRT